MVSKLPIPCQLAYLPPAVLYAQHQEPPESLILPACLPCFLPNPKSNSPSGMPVNSNLEISELPVCSLCNFFFFFSPSLSCKSRP